MSHYFYLLLSVLPFLFFLGFLLGAYAASRFELRLVVTKKSELADATKSVQEKEKELNELLAKLAEETDDKGMKYNPEDLFPSDVHPQYGLPKSLEGGK